MIWNSKNNGTYLIAEIGGNHEGNFEYAAELVQLAISSGVDAVKLQIYSSDNLVSPIEDPSLHRHFNKFQLKKNEYLLLARSCLEKGVAFTSSIWDIESIGWIDPYMSFYKIGSGDLTAYPLLKRVAMAGKPIILSTGLATLDEVRESISYIQKQNKIYLLPDNMALLQCTSMYPIPPSEANLRVMETFRRSFGLTTGYSDHTVGTEAIEVAVAMGAEIIEFHFTDDRKGKTFRDHIISLTQAEVLELREKIKRVRNIQGSSNKAPERSEVESGHTMSFRRAVYLRRKMRAGEVIKEEDLIVLRPNVGIDARDYERLIGRELFVDHEPFQAIKWEEVK